DEGVLVRSRRAVSESGASSQHLLRAAEVERRPSERRGERARRSELVRDKVSLVVARRPREHRARPFRNLSMSRAKGRHLALDSLDERAPPFGQLSIGAAPREDRRADEEAQSRDDRKAQEGNGSRFEARTRRD